MPVAAAPASSAAAGAARLPARATLLSIPTVPPRREGVQVAEKPGHPRLRRWLRVLVAGIACLALFGAVAGVLQTGVLERATEDFLDSQLYPQAVPGESVTLGASGPRPALQVTETSVTKVEPLRPEQRPPADRQLWGVHFTVRNAGDVALVAPWPIRATVKDDLGRFHTVDTRVTAVSGGQLLATARRLPAGLTSSGYLTFRLPAGRSVTEVWLRAGSETGRWKIPLSR